MPASLIAARTASLSSTTSPKCRPRPRGWVRPAASAMNWSPMSMKAILSPARPRSSNSKNRAYQPERLVDVADLERDVVDPDEPRHPGIFHLQGRGVHRAVRARRAVSLA